MPVSPLAPLVRLTNDKTKPRLQEPKSIPRVRLTNDRTSGIGYERAGTSASPAAYAAWAMTVPGSAPWIKGTPAYNYFNQSSGGGGGWCRAFRASRTCNTTSITRHQMDAGQLRCPWWS